MSHRWHDRRGAPWRLTAFIVAVAASVGNGQGPRPMVAEAAILCSVLSYDRHFISAREKAVVIAVLYKKTSPASIGAAVQMGSALNEVARSRLGALKVSITEIGYKEPIELEHLLEGAKVHALYITDGLEGDHPAIAAATVKLKIATLCSSKQAVRDHFSVAVVRGPQKPAVMVNLAHSRAEGMDLSSEVLNLAEIIR